LWYFQAASRLLLTFTGKRAKPASSIIPPRGEQVAK
jgi:hypothetical protein